MREPPPLRAMMSTAAARASGEVGGGRGAQVVAIVLSGVLLALPVHAGCSLVVDLHAIHADVALAAAQIARDDAGERDEPSGIARPALQHREIQQREAAAANDFLAGAGGDQLGKEAAHLGEHGQHADFIEKALGRFDIHELADAAGDFVERVAVERQVHAALGAELVDEQLGGGIAFEVFKEQRRTARAAAAARTPLGDAVGDFGNFQNGIALGLDALEFAGAIQGGDPFSKVVVGQAEPPDRIIYVLPGS